MVDLNGRLLSFRIASAAKGPRGNDEENLRRALALQVASIPGTTKMLHCEGSLILQDQNIGERRI